MANSMFVQGQYWTKRKQIVHLFPVVSVAGGGAVTLRKRSFTAAGSGGNLPTYSLGTAPTSGTGYARGDGEGTRSVSRTGTGAWTLTLSDPYLYLIGVRFNVESASGVSTVVQVAVDSTSNVQTNTSLGNGGVVKLVFSSATATAADPASGDVVYLELVLGQSGAF